MTGRERVEALLDGWGDLTGRHAGGAYVGWPTNPRAMEINRSSKP